MEATGRHSGLDLYRLCSELQIDNQVTEEELKTTDYLPRYPQSLENIMLYSK